MSVDGGVAARSRGSAMSHCTSQYSQVDYRSLRPGVNMRCLCHAYLLCASFEVHGLPAFLAMHAYILVAVNVCVTQVDDSLGIVPNTSSIRVCP